MAESSDNRRNSSSSPSRSSDLSVRVESEVVVGSGTSEEIKCRESRDVANEGSVDNGSTSSSGISGQGLSKVGTLPAEISHADKLESSSNQFKLERSKTESQRHLWPEDAAQIFDDKIPVQEKEHWQLDQLELFVCLTNQEKGIMGRLGLHLFICSN